jgi:hypothetical protein
VVAKLVGNVEEVQEKLQEVEVPVTQPVLDSDVKQIMTNIEAEKPKKRKLKQGGSNIENVEHILQI